MAKTNFQIFNEENTPERTYNDSEYKEATQRVGGVMPGMALSRMHNKMYYQWSAMCKAIANLIVNHGHDCMDSDVDGITRYLEETIVGAATTEITAHRTAAELDHPEKSVRKKHLHPDAYESPALTGTPTAPTAGRGTNNTQIASTAFVAQAIAALVNSAPGALDTLQELAAALGNDANFAVTITNALAGKVSKSGDTITGKIVFSNSDEVKKSIFPSHYYHNVFADDIRSIFVHAYSEVNPPQYQTSYEIRIGAGNGRYKPFLFNNDGLHTDLKGNADTASNASKLGGQPLAWIVDQINAAKTGIVTGNLAENGWVKFANGLIVQWGAGAALTSEETQTITLPIAFPEKCLCVHVSSKISAGINADAWYQIVSQSTTQLVVMKQQSGAGTTEPVAPVFFAIGI